MGPRPDSLRKVTVSDAIKWKNCINTRDAIFLTSSGVLLRKPR